MNEYELLQTEHNNKIVSTETFDEILNTKGITCMYICTTERGRKFVIYGSGKNEEFRITVK